MSGRLKERAAFPSPRQARAPGLRRGTYPAFIRDFVDYDYDDKLTEEQRVWLAAFTEEYYRGWRLKGETQLQNVEQLRSSGARVTKVRKYQDVLSFGQFRHPVSVDQFSPDGHPEKGSTGELRLVAGRAGKDEHELRSCNVQEDEMIARLDAGTDPRKRGRS